jgi:hypothetical protein
MTTPRQPLGYIDPNTRWNEESSPKNRGIILECLYLALVGTVLATSWELLHPRFSILNQKSARKDSESKPRAGRPWEIECQR